MSKLDQTNRKGHEPKAYKPLQTPLLFFLCTVALSLISLYVVHTGYFPFEYFTASVTTGLIHLFGIPAVQNDIIIYLTNAVWEVDTECTALEIMIIFASFVIVYRASYRAKAAGLLMGLPFIFGANIARLLIMAFIDKDAPQYSSFFHDYMWQVAFIIMVMVMWIVWIDMVVKRERKTSVSH